MRVSRPPRRRVDGALHLSGFPRLAGALGALHLSRFPRLAGALRFSRLLPTALALAAIGPTAARGQDGLIIGPRHHGIAFGNAPRVTGIRFNFRDDGLERVDGVNVTIWMPYHEPSGVVNGLAVGVLATGAAEINGIGVGVAGIGASDEMNGIAVGGVGVGAGGSVTGATVGGIGVGAGGRLRGIAVGGIGVGAGGSLEGIAIGGIGVGAGGDVRAISIGGIGVGGGGDVRGVSVGGIGVGGGGSVTGLSLGGVGVGGGGDVRGISIGGIGVGAGGRLSGLAIGGVGVGAPEVRAIAIGSMVGGHDLSGLFIAPLYLRVTNDGEMRGLSVGSVSHIDGTQYGVTVAAFNHARRLRGRALQIGVLNYVRSNPPGLRLLPLINWNAR